MALRYVPLTGAQPQGAFAASLGGWKFGGDETINTFWVRRAMNNSSLVGSFRQNNDGPGWTGNRIEALTLPDKDRPIPFKDNDILADVATPEPADFFDVASFEYNQQLDQAEVLSLGGVVAEPDETFAAQFIFPDPLPDADFFLWDHSQDQLEYTADPIAADEMFASQPVFPDPLDPADFFQWNQPQDQSEWLFPPFEETIEALIAADLIPSTQFPLPDPDFFVWEHRPEQNEWQSPRVTLSNSAEGGSDETSVTVANSGGASGDAWDFVDDPQQAEIGEPFGSSIRFSDDQTVDSLAYRFDQNNSLIGLTVSWKSSGKIQRAQNQIFLRAYFWYSRYPQTADSEFFRIQNPVDGVLMRCGVTINGEVFIGNQTATSLLGGFKVPTEKWFRAEAMLLRGNQVGLPNQTSVVQLRIFLDPNSTSVDASVGRQGVGEDSGDNDATDVHIGIDDNQAIYTYYIDNVGLDTNDWLGPVGTAPTGLGQPSLIAAGHPHDVVQPDVFFLAEYKDWEHRPEQNEWLSPFIEAIENVIGSQPDGLELNPLPGPDFFQWNQPQDIAESAIPEGISEASIDVLVAADLFSSGEGVALTPPALVFDVYEQNTDPPAGTIPPDLSGNIRKVPRWAKQKNFYAGGR